MRLPLRCPPPATTLPPLLLTHTHTPTHTRTHAHAHALCSGHTHGGPRSRLGHALLGHAHGPGRIQPRIAADADAGRHLPASTMYFHMLLKKDVVIFPKDFGPNMQQRLIDKLIEKVEGSCSGRYGFVICVTEVVTLGKGKIREGGRLRPCRYCCCCARALARHLLWVPATFAGAGVVMFQMSFNAIVFRPFKGEALDAIVKSVNKMGFFAEVGPLDVFVSKHLIPADMSFDPQSNPAAWARPHQIDAHVEAALLQRELRCRALSS